MKSPWAIPKNLLPVTKLVPKPSKKKKETKK